MNQVITEDTTDIRHWGGGLLERQLLELGNCASVTVNLTHGNSIAYVFIASLFATRNPLVYYLEVT